MSPKAVEDQQNYDAARRQAREAYRKAIIAADQQYVSDLDAALKNAMQSLNIDLARILDDQKKSAIEVLERDQAELYVAGEWTVTRAAETAIVPNGLVGYWPLDGNTINWTTGVSEIPSGQRNNGRLINIPTTTSRMPDNIGHGLQFNGSNQYVSIIAPTTDTQAASICAWFTTTTFTPGSRFIFTQVNASNNANMNLEVIAGHASFSIYNGTPSPHIKSVSIVNTGQWVYVCGTRDGATLSIYVNGVLESSVANGWTTPVGTAYATIGANYVSGYVSFFNGTIEDVRIYNRALSAQEVQQLFSASH